MANKQSNASRASTINIAGNVNDSTIHVGDTIKTGYTSKEVSALITQITSTFQPKPFDGTCPYMGLDVFEEGDAELFFGRAKLVEELVSKVKASRTVFITGPSGSGKSSLVRAGLIPALKQGKLRGSERWLYTTMKPGRDPFEALAVAFSRLKSPELGNYFREHSHQPAALNECAESALSEYKDQRLVLFIDQFEEVFTQINQEEERVAFLNLLTHATDSENGRVILLFSMRSDFLPNCAVYPKLNATLNRQFIQIGAMQADELVSAIAQPALRVGLRIDPDLIAQIINDMKGEPGALPLMSFALKDLFDKEPAKGGMIALTLNGYFENKGINEALQRHADAALAQLSEHEKKLAQSIFSNLIEIGRGTQDTKRTAPFNELVPADSKADEVQAVVQKLADARLVTTEEENEEFTITHEKLIDAWPWLKKLINENREAITLQNEIASDAKGWEENKRDASYLYSGGRLANIWEQVQKQKLALGQLAQDFVKAGRRRQQRVRAVLISVVSIVLIVAIMASILSRNQAKIALARQLASQAQLIYATQNSKQLTALLLAVESQNLSPNADASSFLINNNLSAILMSSLYSYGPLLLATFTPDGNYVVTCSYDGPAQLWNVATGKEISSTTFNGTTVTSVAFSPDGNYLAAGSYVGTIHIWDITTGNEVSFIADNNAWVTRIAFSPDGKYIVSGNKDGAVYVWEATTGNELANVSHDAGINSVAFSPDGQYLVSGDNDGTIIVWKTDTEDEVSRMTHDASVTSVVFSPDGKYVVSGSDDGTARVWKTVTGDEISRMTYKGRVTSIAFSPDGQSVVSGSSHGNVRVWELLTGNEISRMTHDDTVTSIAFSPDGQYVASGSTDGTARVWSVLTGNEISRMTHIGPIYSVAFSADGKYVVSGGDDGTANVWKIAKEDKLVHMTLNEAVWSVKYSSDGKYVVSGSDDGTARVWNAATGKEISRMTHDDIVTSIAFSPNGKYVVSGGADGTARVWDSTTGKEISRMTYDDIVTSIAFSPNGKYVVSGSDDGTARVWDSATGKEISHMTHDGKITSVAFSPDGKYVVSGSNDGTARIWEVATGKEISRITNDLNPGLPSVSSVAFSPDGKYVASGSGIFDGTASIWDVVTGNEITRMAHDYEVTSITFSPDGKYVVSGSRDRTARVWDAATGKEISRMTHDSSVNSVAFSPDGKYVVSGSTDGTARIWNVITGNEISRMTHKGAVNSVAFSPEGTYVVSSSNDGSIYIWMWEPDKLITDACLRFPRNLTRAEWQQYIGDILPYTAVCSNLPIDPER